MPEKEHLGTFNLNKKFCICLFIIIGYAANMLSISLSFVLVTGEMSEVKEYYITVDLFSIRWLGFQKTRRHS